MNDLVLALPIVIMAGIGALLMKWLAEVSEYARGGYEALLSIKEIHRPCDEEAEFWFDQPGHDEHFPACTSEALCQGHLITVKVCTECGYEHDGERAVFRSWPCPTYRTASLRTTQSDVTAAHPSGT